MYLISLRLALVQYLPKESIISKMRIVVMPVVDKPFSVIVCVVAPKVMEDHVVLLIHEASLYVYVSEYSHNTIGNE